LQDHAIVEPRVGSEWVSNIVLVHKKDRALWYCIDYRGLNTVMTKANYPLPRIDACHDSSGMRSRYWQVLVLEQDVDNLSCIRGISALWYCLLAFVMPLQRISVW